MFLVYNDSEHSSEDINKLLSDNDCCYGLRVDDFEYKIGDICHKSHQLFQDPSYDENGELIYPHCENGIYKGFYDAGELDGTCAIEVEANVKSIINALEKVNDYFGNYIYLIKGISCENGNDIGEIIINDAIVVEKFKRY